MASAENRKRNSTVQELPAASAKFKRVVFDMDCGRVVDSMGDKYSDVAVLCASHGESICFVDRVSRRNSLFTLSLVNLINIVVSKSMPIGYTLSSLRDSLTISVEEPSTHNSIADRLPHFILGTTERIIRSFRILVGEFAFI